jgi:hypothetical protein
MRAPSGCAQLAIDQLARLASPLERVSALGLRQRAAAAALAPSASKGRRTGWPEVGRQQKVTVEHVHVHAGGQAVVGVVESPGG